MKVIYFLHQPLTQIIIEHLKRSSFLEIDGFNIQYLKSGVQAFTSNLTFNTSLVILEYKIVWYVCTLLKDVEYHILAISLT